MADLLKCSQGHEWELPPDSTVTERTICPTCGESVVAPAPDDRTKTLILEFPQPRADDLWAEPASGNAETQPTSAANTARQIPGFEILGELGRGGMGVVYQARQVGLNRLVALKMILSGSHAGAEELTRFRAEAEAVARLQHANIVQIYEIGEHEGRPYFALEFVDSGSLAQKLGGTPLSANEAAALSESLARAVQYAHEHGVIHRDLKPANVLLAGISGEGSAARDESKQPGSRKSVRSFSASTTSNRPLSSIPKITDFGLAKQIDVDSGQTRSGAIVGTPSYMAPEQAAGLSKNIGPAADLYSLGAMLYEMLVGRPPFRAATMLQTLEQVRTQEPVAPSRLQPGLPRDLETICLKCLQKEPAKRYESAAALADDLAKFLGGEPISARPVSTTERAWRWTKRKPLLAGLYATVALLLLAVIIVPSVLAYRLDTARRFANDETKRANRNLKRANDETDNAKAQQKIAETQTDIAQKNQIKAKDSEEKAKAAQVREEAERKAAEWSQYVAEINLAQQAAERRQTGPMLALLEGLRPMPNRDDLRGPEWYHLWHVANRGLRATFRDNAFPLSAMACSPDGQTIATGDPWGFIRLRDRQTGQLRKTLWGHSTLVLSLSFVADGATLASASSDHTIKLWDVGTGDTRASYPMPATGRAAFSLNGKWAAFGNNEGATLIDLASGETLGTLSQGGPCINLAFSSDSRSLATSNNGSVNVFDLETRQHRFTRRHHSGQGLAFSPDGKAVVSAGVPPLQILNAETGTELATLTGSAFVPYCVTFSPDGRRLAAGAMDGTVKVFDFDAGHTNKITLEETHSFAHADWVRDLAFNSDGESLISVAHDRAIKVWDLTPFAPTRFPASNDSVWSLALSPDGATAYTASDGQIRVWDTRTAKENFVVKDRGGLAVAISPDGNLLAAEQVQVTLYDAQTGQELRRLQDAGQKTNFLTLSFSPDGKLLAGGCQDGTVRWWDVESGRELFAAPPKSGWVRVGSFSRDGKRVAAANPDGTIDLWDVERHSVQQTVKAHRNNIFSLEYSPVDGTLLSSGGDGPLRLWDAESGTEQVILPSTPTAAEIHKRAAWMPDGKTLVASARAGMTILDAATRRRRATLPHDADSTYSLAVSANGRVIAAGGQDGSLQLWHIAAESDVLTQSAVSDPRERTATGQLLLALDESHGLHAQQGMAAYQIAGDLAADLSDKFPENSSYAQWQLYARYRRALWIGEAPHTGSKDDAEHALSDVYRARRAARREVPG